MHYSCVGMLVIAAMPAWRLANMPSLASASCAPASAPIAATVALPLRAPPDITWEKDRVIAMLGSAISGNLSAAAGSSQQELSDRTGMRCRTGRSVNLLADPEGRTRRRARCRGRAGLVEGVER